jgi:hypothetical protein
VNAAGIFVAFTALEWTKATVFCMMTTAYIVGLLSFCGNGYRMIHALYFLIGAAFAALALWALDCLDVVMIYKIRTKDELYIFINGQLVYKRWIKLGYGRLFNNIKGY